MTAQALLDLPIPSRTIPDFAIPQREIPRDLPCPELTPRAVQSISELIFPPDSLPDGFDESPALVVAFGSHFDFGAYATMVQRTVESIQGRGAKEIVLAISGGNPQFGDSLKIEKPEADMILDTRQEMYGDLPEGVMLVVDRLATNSLQNVLNLAPGVEGCLGMSFSKVPSITALCEDPLKGRQLAYLMKFAPDADIHSQSYTVREGAGSTHGREVWPNADSSRRRIWAEVKRIVSYGKKGDLAYEPYREQIKEMLEDLGARVNGFIPQEDLSFALR